MTFENPTLIAFSFSFSILDDVTSIILGVSSLSVFVISVASWKPSMSGMSMSLRMRLNDFFLLEMILSASFAWAASVTLQPHFSSLAFMNSRLMGWSSTTRMSRL